MATYGDFPGVRVTTSGGGISGVQVGEEEKLVIFAPGGDGAEADVNTPTQIAALSDADTQFGAGSPLAQAMKLAVANGANREYLFGVRVEKKDVNETITGADHTGGGKLANLPVAEDSLTVTDTTAGSEVGHVLRFETNTDNTSTDFTGLSSDLPVTEGGETVASAFINPLTGEWVVDASSDYEFGYSRYDYQSAIDGADDVLNEGDTGVYAAATEAPVAHSALVSKVGELRGNFQLVQGVAGARPNKTLKDASGGWAGPGYTASDYADTSDNDSLYLLAPGRQASGESVVPAVAGLMAGHAISDPIYNDALSGLGELTQRLTGTEADNLREADVIPVRQAGSIRVKSNRSTGFTSNGDWERDFWRRRIVDRVLLVTKAVGDDTVGRINDPGTREDAQIAIRGELVSMVRDRLIKANTGDETNWIVEVTEDLNNPNQVNISVGITPMGVVKRIDETVTINA